MLRGVNKRVVEITDTQNEFFERIYFVVKEGTSVKDMKKLRREALKYAQEHSGRIPSLQSEEEIGSTVTVKVDHRVKKIFLRVLKYMTVACAGGAILFAVQVIFF